MTEGAGTVVIGLGNDLLGDDGFGVIVARKLQEIGIPGADIVETAEHGLRLLDYLDGYEKAIIIDAYIAEEKGMLRETEIEEDENVAAPTLHCLSLGEAIFIGRRAGLRLPQHVRLYSVTVLNTFVIGSGLSPEVEAAVPLVICRVLKELGMESDSCTRSRNGSETAGSGSFCFTGAPLQV